MSGGDAGRGGRDEPPGLSRRLGCHLHLPVFLALLALWTWGLLEPRPVPQQVRAEFSYDAWKLLSKITHGGVYAALAVLAATAPLPRLGRFVLVGLLLLHGAGTELAQYLMAVGRTGQATDVLIDWIGIAGGYGVVAASQRRARG